METLTPHPATIDIISKKPDNWHDVMLAFTRQNWRCRCHPNVDTYKQNDTIDLIWADDTSSLEYILNVVTDQTPVLCVGQSMNINQTGHAFLDSSTCMIDPQEIVSKTAKWLEFVYVSDYLGTDADQVINFQPSAYQLEMIEIWGATPGDSALFDVIFNGQIKINLGSPDNLLSNESDENFFLFADINQLDENFAQSLLCKIDKRDTALLFIVDQNKSLKTPLRSGFCERPLHVSETAQFVEIILNRHYQERQYKNSYATKRMAERSRFISAVNGHNAEKLIETRVLQCRKKDIAFSLICLQTDEPFPQSSAFLERIYKEIEAITYFDQDITLYEENKIIITLPRLESEKALQSLNRYLGVLNFTNFQQVRDQEIINLSFTGVHVSLAPDDNHDILLQKVKSALSV